MGTSTWGGVPSSTTSTPATYSGSSPVMRANGQQYVIKWSVDMSSTPSCTAPDYHPGKAYTYDQLVESWYDGAACNVAERHQLSEDQTYRLPDGSRIYIDKAGNYRIDDKDAKVVYQASRIRDFSPHLNASDMLAKFVDYVRTIGVKQGEVLGLPIELFVNWLVIEAAVRDKDPVPSDVVPVNTHPAIRELVKPKCLTCGRFIPRAYHARRFDFCNADHGAKYVENRLAGRALAG